MYDFCLNTFDTAAKETKQFSNPKALSISLAALLMPQPQAFGLLLCNIYTIQIL